jgi:hypothetical protein
MVVFMVGDAELARWPLLRRGRPGLALVDELARLQLTARRLGCEIQLRDACDELCELLELAGLTGVVTGCELRQVGGEAEGGEQLGVHEGVEPGDAVP